MHRLTLFLAAFALLMRGPLPTVLGAAQPHVTLALTLLGIDPPSEQEMLDTLVPEYPLWVRALSPGSGDRPINWLPGWGIYPGLAPPGLPSCLGGAPAC